MSTPWLEDACGLVDAFRAKELSPLEALDECIGAMEASPLNAFSFTDFETAREGARNADVTLPFGGVPWGVKELERVEGWPYTEASMLFKDRVSDHDDTSLSRLRAAGAVLAAQTTASEFGGINCTSTELHGTTRNPWNPERTPGGSSGGTAAAVAGGLLPIATGSDGGGSIRIPAGFTGLFGLKATYGRVPKGPAAGIEPLTSVLGCLTRSVRDTARYFDCCNGFDQRDPLSLPVVGGWEAALGTYDLSGKTAAIVVDLGIARVRDEVAEVVAAAAERLAAAGESTAGHRRAGPAAAARRVGHGQPAGVRGRPGGRLPRPTGRTLARDAGGGRGGTGTLQPRTGRFHRALPATAQRGHGRPLRGGGFRVLLDQSRRGLRGGGASAVDHPRGGPDP